MTDTNENAELEKALKLMLKDWKEEEKPDADPYSDQIQAQMLVTGKDESWITMATEMGFDSPDGEW